MSSRTSRLNSALQVSDTSMRLATSQGGSFGQHAVDAQVLDDEAAAREVHAEPADRHLALEPIAARLLGARLERGTEIDRQRRHQHHRDDHANRDGESPGIAVDDAARAAAGGRARVAVG